MNSNGFYLLFHLLLVFVVIGVVTWSILSQRRQVKRMTNLSNETVDVSPDGIPLVLERQIKCGTAHPLKIGEESEFEELGNKLVILFFERDNLDSEAFRISFSQKALEKILDYVERHPELRKN